MPRPRTRPNHAFIQELLDQHGCRNLKELSEITGIPYDTLLGYADMKPNNQNYEAIIRDSYLLGLDPLTFMLKMLGKSISEILEQHGIEVQKAS